MITLRNDFHNTEVNLMVGPGEEISQTQQQRAKRVLCGGTGCACSNALGVRGPQEVEIREEVEPNIRGECFEVFVNHQQF